MVGLVLEFLFFSVNYSRTERMQFEDDEYYYYVKAVPKIVVSAPEMSVKHINERQDQSEWQELQDSQETVLIDTSNVQRAAGEPHSQRKRPALKQEEHAKKIDHARAADEILLTRSLTKELGINLEDLEDK